MNELDQFWSVELTRLIENARRSGRADVADYLELRARNDAIREIGVRWLIETLIAISAGSYRVSASIEIIRDEPHRFDMFKATMAGTRVIFQQGVRCLTVEAGWTRTPGDGFMRNGVLAAARLKHLGMSKMDVELGLLMHGEEPLWYEFAEGKREQAIALEDLNLHFNTFLG